MKKAICLGILLGFLAIQSFAFFQSTEAKTTMYQGTARIEFNEEIGEDIAIIPTSIALPEFSAELQEFEGPEFFIEHGTESSFILRGVIKPGIYYGFGLNIKIGYNQASAKEGLAYEEDLLIHPRPNGKFEVEIPFTPVLSLSRVFVVAEIYYQDQLLAQQLFKTDTLPKRPEDKPEVAEETEQTDVPKTEEDVSKKPKPAIPQTEEEETTEEDVLIPETKTPTLSDKLFKPQTGNPLIDHWPIFSALALVVLLILIGVIRKGIKKRHLNVLLLVLGLGSYFFVANSFDCTYAGGNCPSGGTYKLPQAYPITYYSSNEAHPLSMMPIRFQGTYEGEAFDANSVFRIGVHLNKRPNNASNTNFEWTGENAVQISPNVYRYSKNGESVDVTFDPTENEFSFELPLAMFKRGTHITKPFDDGVWHFWVKVHFQPSVGNKIWVFIPYELDGDFQYIGIDSLAPSFDFNYRHDTPLGDDTYPTAISDINNPDPLIPAPTNQPIKLEIECLDNSTFDPARNGNADPPYSDFEPSGCMESDGSSSGEDPVTREVFVKGNFCDDPDRCDTIGYRTFRTCDGSANCTDREVFIDWYDPIPPKFNRPFGLEPSNDRVTYDEDSELPTGVRFIKSHPTNSALDIKMSGLESPRASIAAGGDMHFQFSLDDEDYHIDADGFCYGIGCPVGFDPVLDASPDDLYDSDACGFEADGTRLDDQYIDPITGICDQLHRSCLNDQGFVGELNENPTGRECIPNCPVDYTLNGTQCDPIP